MNPGDLVLFSWPGRSSNLDLEATRVGLVFQILATRPGDSHGNELLVLHDGERWSVPESWCRLIRVGDT
jgi:hypothetical protein